MWCGKFGHFLAKFSLEKITSRDGCFLHTKVNSLMFFRCRRVSRCTFLFQGKTNQNRNHSLMSHSAPDLLCLSLSGFPCFFWGEILVFWVFLQKVALFGKNEIKKPLFFWRFSTPFFPSRFGFPCFFSCQIFFLLRAFPSSFSRILGVCQE